MVDDNEMCYSCDACGEETESPVSIHLPLKGGMRSPVDLCPECSKEEMQRMVDRLGHEHGSSMLMDIKSRAAKREGPQGIKAKTAPQETSDDEEEG